MLIRANSILLSSTIMCLLCMAAISFAQPYEPIFLYDEIGEIGQGIGVVMIAPIGDQDGDGYDDILYTVQDVEDGEQLWTNYLRIVYGGDHPPYRTLDFAHTLTDTTQGTPLWYEWAHHSCGDYNGDGDIDIMVELQAHAGGPLTWMYLFLGGLELFDTLWDWRSNGYEGLVSYGSVGDFNADGSADYIRASGNPNFNFYSGGWPNMQSSPAWTFGVEEQPFSDRLGAGDINDDGWGDFTFQNITYIESGIQDSVYNFFWLGGPGADSIPDITLSLDIPESEQWVGYWRIIGDVNGDGYDDMITYSQRNQDPGRQHIYAGGDPPDFDTPVGFFDPPIAVAEMFGVWVFENLGDINNDGYEDTGFYDWFPPIAGGWIYIYLGGDPPVTSPAYGIVPDIGGFAVGQEMQPAGDFNNDGIDDWMFVGRDIEDRGRVIVVAGDERFGMAADEHPSLQPSSFILHPCYPNPFNPSTTISFSLPHAQNATIAVYDLTGRTVSTLADEIMNAGEHTVTFNASGLPSGIYFARMTAGNQMITKKMVLLK
jgi:hypothetical protein